MAFEIVLVGASLGGLHALEILLGGLPKDFPWPVVVVLHQNPSGGPSLVAYLQPHCPLPLGEVEDKDVIMPGRVYLAPPDYHLLVERGAFALSTEAPVLHARPSIDVLFESAADAYGGGAIGVILTGASADGARGASLIKERGGTVVVQDPLTAESPATPQAAIAATEVDRVAPLAEIAGLLASLSRERGKTTGSWRKS